MFPCSDRKEIFLKTLIIFASSTCMHYQVFAIFVHYINNVWFHTYYIIKINSFKDILSLCLKKSDF